jgi:hypothetical protein
MLTRVVRHSKDTLSALDPRAREECVCAPTTCGHKGEVFVHMAIRFTRQADGVGAGAVGGGCGWKWCVGMCGRKWVALVRVRVCGVGVGGGVDGTAQHSLVQRRGGQGDGGPEGEGGQGGEKGRGPALPATPQG